MTILSRMLKRPETLASFSSFLPACGKWLFLGQLLLLECLRISTPSALCLIFLIFGTFLSLLERERDSKHIPNLLAEGKAGRRKWQLWHRELFRAASSIPTEVSLGCGYPQEHRPLKAPSLAKPEQRWRGEVSLLQPLQSGCGAGAHLPAAET